MPQNYGELLPGEATPLDFLQVKGDKEEMTRIRTWLGSMKFTADEMEHPIRELSGGQKAKLVFYENESGGERCADSGRADPEIFLRCPIRSYGTFWQTIRGPSSAFPMTGNLSKRCVQKVYRLTGDGLQEVEKEKLTE